MFSLLNLTANLFILYFLNRLLGAIGHKFDKTSNENDIIFSTYSIAAGYFREILY